jgi:predicted dehydrogenase
MNDMAGKENSPVKNVKWGIIGCGAISERFMQGLLAVPNTEIISAWSHRPESVTSFCDKYGAKACSSVDELLASDIDAIYIATLPDSHSLYSTAALRAGKHVLCEKPACINLSDLEIVLHEARNNKLLFMEAMKPPFFPLYRKLKAHLAEDPIGEIGYLRAGSSVVGVNANHPSLSHELVGGSIMGIGVYEAFLAADWLGDAAAVQALGRIGDSGVDLFSVFQTQHSRGFGQFYTGFEVYGKGDALICGAKGHVTIHQSWWNPIAASIAYSDGRLVELNEPFSAGGLNYEIAHFCELLNDGQLESPIISHDISRKMIGLLDKVRAEIGLKFKGE